MKRSSSLWSPSASLELAFVYLAFSVVGLAALALLFWFLITFVVPFYTYSKTTQIILNNGQILQVKYPNLVLAEETATYITLIISGVSNPAEPVTFTVTMPAGLTVVGPDNQAQSKTVQLSTSDQNSITQLRIGVENSQTVGGAWLFVRQPVTIRSKFMPDTQNIEIGIETISWISMRRIVNNTFNERSPLILLLTGFLSGIGTLVIQYSKSRRDRVREDYRNKEDVFRKQMGENFLQTISRFTNLEQESQEDDANFYIYKNVVEQLNWESELQQIILQRLKARDNLEAKWAADILDKLYDMLHKKNKSEDSISLLELCRLTSINDLKNTKLNTKQVSCLIVSYKRWRDLKSLITSLIHECSHLPENLPVIYSSLAQDRDGQQLLVNSNLRKIIDDHIGKLSAGTAQYEAAQNINRLLSLEINWRPLWSDKERKLSEKTLRWLSAHWYESGTIDNNISPGSEYAELDSKLVSLAIHHPVFEQVNGPFPAIVFGDEGMGKSAAALWLTYEKRKQIFTEGGSSKVFPVYAPFEAGVDIRKWIVEKISQALIDFTADNPRQFLNAPDFRKMAMGRLMVRYTQSVEALRLNFFSSPFDDLTGDLEQVLEYLSNIRYMPIDRLAKDETLNLLYLAYPDIFDQVYFLWDIRSSARQDDTVHMISEVEELVLPLARQNFYLKIFAPIGIAKELGEITGFRNPQKGLVWEEPLLRNLIETRVKMFNALWERGIDDPVGLVIATAGHSPRRIIRFLIQLLDYIDEHLQEGEKLNISILNELATTQPEGRRTHLQNRQEAIDYYESAVFVSYAWGGESEHTVDDLERAFAESGISIIRDKKDLDYKGSILEFEQRIGRGQCIVLVISDKYLRSEHCMYELVVVDENLNLRERIFPIVLTDADIYKPIDRLQYIKYWDEQIEKLNEALKEVNVMTNLTGIINNLEKYVRIRASFDHLSGLLSDMNALTPEIHAMHGFSTMISSIKQSIGGNTSWTDKQ